MLRSLWAGVSGLQAHQIALDIEGNNIANVNTAGYKYSRANFSDMLSQTSKIATAPQGALGGKNPMQVGLGTQVSSITKIFKQGSVQTTDKNTDLAIQGDGFFVVSPDGGSTYKYTRNGDFVFDALGNFTDSNGYIVQGWVRNKDTNKIDSTAPIKNITIQPGLTTPANSSSYVKLKANLNSGNTIKNKTATYALDSTAGLSSTEETEDMGVLFTGDGNAFNLQAGQGINITLTDPTNSATTITKTFQYGTDFTTTEDLRSAMQTFIRGNVTYKSTTAEVSINKEGKFQILNPAGGNSLDISIAPYTATGITENTFFTQTMGSLSGLLPSDATGSLKLSQPITAAVHASSIDIYDSLGTKHTVRLEFRKKAQNTWSFSVTVPAPSTLAGATPTPNILEGGTINFNSNGSLSQYNPPGITFSGNNGSSPNQQINFNFGSTNGFDGITSYDATSNTAGISQDGFPGGDLSGIRVDETGTLIGSFTNGRSFGLAQVSMAKFTNNNGLESDGGNAFIQTSNSGDPIIGQAAVGGRGFIQASALEMSNVDLSRSLTQLIIVQRGFQANAKTITTSDQILNTLLQLKR
ncbi:MAG: flagellar hook-basal body complex protein [Epsilonproteobacteria bacterium]|nr:flagellar hook-basal body complex protein [Campylobacterota bacterium]